MTTETPDEDAFVHGILVGVALAAIGLHLLLVTMSTDWVGFYRDMGTLELPAMTRLTLSKPWQLGVPLVGGIAIGTLIVRRPRMLALYIAVAVALCAAAAMTWWYPSAPMSELAGKIQP